MEEQTIGSLAGKEQYFFHQQLYDYVPEQQAEPNDVSNWSSTTPNVSRQEPLVRFPLPGPCCACTMQMLWLRTSLPHSRHALVTVGSQASNAERAPVSTIVPSVSGYPLPACAVGFLGTFHRLIA